MQGPHIFHYLSHIEPGEVSVFIAELAHDFVPDDLYIFRVGFNDSLDINLSDLIKYSKFQGGQPVRKLLFLFLVVIPILTLTLISDLRLLIVIMILLYPIVHFHDALIVAYLKI